MQSPSRVRSAQPAPRRRVAGGVVWIGLVAVLLAGVVALNVAVLRLNVQLNKVNAERTRLKADKQAIASQLSLAGATTRIQTLASRDGLVPADRLTTSPVAAGRPARGVGKSFDAALFVALLQNFAAVRKLTPQRRAAFATVPSAHARTMCARVDWPRGVRRDAVILVSAARSLSVIASNSCAITACYFFTQACELWPNPWCGVTCITHPLRHSDLHSPEGDRRPD